MIKLTDEEATLIMKLRQEKTEQQRRKEKQKTCNHAFRYSGHSHNDDCYECMKCGAIEWR